MVDFIHNVKNIDLNRSEWDEKKSDPSKGMYELKHKVYVRDGDYLQQDTRPPWVFMWNRYEPRTNYKEVRDWQIKYQATFVTLEDPYWPEGVPPDAEGKYVYGDAVLMKIPLEVWMNKRIADSERSERAGKSLKRKFEQTAKAEGAGISEDAIARIFGEK